MKRLCALLLCSCVAAPAAAQPAPSGRAGSIGGRVLRPDGVPQPEAEVVAARRGRDGRLRLLPWRARTAFDGRYDIAGVPAGRYLVLVRIVGGDSPMAGRPLATLFPGVSTTEPGTAVEVFAGVPVEGVDIWLLPAPRRFQVEGRVIDLQGRALENVSLEFGPPHTRADSVWTVTDPGGLFALSGVPPGPLVLRARADGPTGPLIGVASTELAVESAQDLTVVVREPVRVRGRLQPAGDAPLPAGLRVSMVPTLLRPSALYPAEAVAPGANGRFELTSAAGEHELQVEGLPPGWTVRRVRHGASPAMLKGLWLTPETAFEDLRVEIGPAPVPSASAR
jgi:hypothetical protein